MVSHPSESAAMSVYVASRHTGLVGQGRHGGDFLQGSSSSHLFQKGEKKKNPEYFLSPEEMQLAGPRTGSGLLKLEGVDVTPQQGNQRWQTEIGWAAWVLTLITSSGSLLAFQNSNF